jgi:hypothetical protein
MPPLRFARRPSRTFCTIITVTGSFPSASKALAAENAALAAAQPKRFYLPAYILLANCPALIPVNCELRTN